MTPRPARAAAAREVRGPLLLLLAVVLAVAATAHLLGPTSTAGRAVVGAAEALVALTAAARAARTAAHRALPRPLRLTWGVLAAGLLSWTAGQAVFLTVDLGGGDPTATTAADVPFLLWGVLAVAASFSFLRLRTLGTLGTRTLGARTLLDGALTACALLTALVVLWLDGALPHLPGRPVEFAFPLAFQVLDVVYLTLTVMAVLHGGPTRAGVLAVAAGAAVTAGDAVYFLALTTPAGFATGGLADLCWLTGFGLFAVAASPDNPPPPPPPDPGDPVPWGLAVPYLAFVPAAALAVHRLWSRADPAVLTGLVVLIVLVLLRQYLVVHDHRALLATAERQRRQLEVLAHVDPLTGLVNRRRFSQVLTDAVGDGLRSGGHVVVAFVDLDRFKEVNDTLGHAAGDELLRAVADRLASSVRVADHAARWGGDEFALLVTDDVAAEDVAERLCAVLAAPFTVAGAPLHASASTGAVRESPRRLHAERTATGAPADVEDLVEALLARADALMYERKRRTRPPAPAARPAARRPQPAAVPRSS
ncbi:diguanylate cyclase domain-containing protein [Kineococcus esterisolvens]|uniref:diguanylate cyclase domain-containing protein n=1 Tax=unclassified Kineococcus TaxID=2621656 RepID=UPI003D7CB15A